MADTSHIVFEDFLRELKRAGFALSLHDYIEFTAVFDEFGKDKESFKYYLAPIICRNKEEQEQFYELYHRYYMSPVPPMRRGVVQPPPSSYYKEPWSPTMLFRSFLFWISFTLLLAVSIKIRMMFLAHQKPAISYEDVIKKDTVISSTGPMPEVKNPVFVAKKIPVHSDSGELKSKVTAAGAPIEKENTVHSTAFAWLVVLGLACLAVSTSFFPQKKSKFLPEADLDTRRGDDAPVDLPFQPKDHLIQKLPVITRLATRLNLPIPTGFFQLDIKKTIHSCVTNYGLLEPVYKDLERRPHYLILIDKKHTLFRQLSHWLVQTLMGEGVSISYYFFDDLSIFPVLRERHDPDRLIVLTDRNALAEEILELSEEIPVEDIQRTLSPGGRQYTADLREYLDDEDLFQWVCALAVYPTIKWDVILSIGNAVLASSRSLHKLNYTNLLKIIRIQWLNGNVIPHDVRLMLLKSMDTRTEIAAREKLIALLKESDELITAGSPAHKEQLMLLYTQSFVLYANDPKKNRQYEQDAKKFLFLWDKKAIPDLATVIYLKNEDKEWDTPVRSTENASRSVGPNKFLSELLAMRVISDPVIRRYFRNAGYCFFAILCLLYLFKDTIQGWGINQALGLVERDYVNNQVVLRIPVTDCLRKRSNDGKLTVALNMYDNNRYTQTATLSDRDTLTVMFGDIMMSGKSPDKETFQVIINNNLSIPCTYREFYPRYDVILQGADCSGYFHPYTPHMDMKPTHPGAAIQ